MKKLILGLAKYSGFFALSKLLTKRRLRILGYHGIWFSGEHYGNFLFMTRKTFCERMQWLKDSGYQVLKLDDALGLLYEERLPRNSVVITIDDGWYGTHVHMLPVLKKYDFPATLYVCTAPVDHQFPEFNVTLRFLIARAKVDQIGFDGEELGKSSKFSLRSASDKERSADILIKCMRRWGDEQKMRFLHLVSERTQVPIKGIIENKQLHFMSYQDIEDAALEGVDIQLHSHSHLLNLGQPESLVDEINVNRQKLSSSVTGDMCHFCYPGGIYSARLRPYLEKSGIKSAVLTESGLNDSRTHKYELKRILDGEELSQLELEAELSGFLEVARKVKSIFSASVAS